VVSFALTAFGSGNLTPKASFHDAPPAVWRPGVGSVTKVSPISDEKRGS
jgi:hypothetical protein